MMYIYVEHTHTHTHTHTHMECECAFVILHVSPRSHTIEYSQHQEEEEEHRANTGKGAATFIHSRKGTWGVMASASTANASLLEALAGCLDADAARRGHAEAFIRAAEQQAGYAVELANVALGTQCEIGARQLAAVLLKKLVNERWSALDLADSGANDSHMLATSTTSSASGNENGHSMPGFVVPDHDKQLLKQMLVHGLGDNELCIRVAIGVAIAAIAYRDWPEQWPELTGVLVDAVRTKRTPALGTWGHAAHTHAYRIFAREKKHRCVCI